MTTIYSILFLFLFSGCSSLDQNRLPQSIRDVLSSVQRKTEDKIFEKRPQTDFFKDGYLGNEEITQYLDRIRRKLSFGDQGILQGPLSVLKTSRVQAFTDFTQEIYITRGMLNMIDNEDELACLIGHEIGHHIGKSWERRKDNWQGQVLSKALSVLGADLQWQNQILSQEKDIYEHGWGQEIESEADRIGADFAAKAGYDPYALCDLFERLSKKVNMDLLYRVRKLKGTHPALDARAAALKAYLRSKGHVPGKIKHQTEDYRHAIAIVSPSASLARLEAIHKEIRGKRLTVEQFISVMEEVSGIARRTGITREALATYDRAPLFKFMEEEIYQDTPFKGYEEDIALLKREITDILDEAGRMAVGSMPVVGNAIGLYELLEGKDLFTGEPLSAGQRTISALAVFVGSDKVWREVASGIEKELKESLNEARGFYENTLKETRLVTHEPPEIGQKVYRIFGKDMDKNIDEKGSDLLGNSWTPMDPDTVAKARTGLGLPDQNKGRFVIEGRLLDTEGIRSQPAEPLHGNPGGNTEYIVPNPEKQIKIEKVSGANPEF